MKSRQRTRRAPSGLFLLAIAGATSASFAVACSGAPTPEIDDLEGSGTPSTTGTTNTTSTTTPASTGASPAATPDGDAGAGSDAGSGDDDADASAGDAGTGTSKDSGSGPTPDASSTPPTGTHPPTTPPSRTCTYAPDANGYATLTSPQGTYVVRLPAGYVKTKAYPVIIGTHGCGDTAENFCSWAPAAYNQSTNAEENDQLDYIAISVEDVASGCWNLADSDKVLAALDDAASCFYVDQAHVLMAGYSSGAAVAYKVGLSNASRFAGILIEDGALYDNGSAEASLLANATWKINIAHIAHSDDGDYPLAQVEADWTKIKAAGFPLTTYDLSEGTGHSGTSIDWYGTLDPFVSKWAAP
jgi:predicted esterase